MKPEAEPANPSPEARPSPARRPEIVLIAAVAEKNRVIGRGMDLPWRIPEDLKRFKRLTLGRPLVMGRKTFESVLHQFGGPLPKRRNVVVSTTGRWPEYPEVEVYGSLAEALAALADSPVVFIGGGGTIYEQCLPLADRLELTLVSGDYEGDAFFPPFEHLVGTVFDVAAEEAHEGYRFVTYVRKGSDAPAAERAA
ncbi:dihydrofolate reductase [Rhodocaloribacter sp.]